MSESMTADSDITQSWSNDSRQHFKYGCCKEAFNYTRWVLTHNKIAGLGLDLHNQCNFRAGTQNELFIPFYQKKVFCEVAVTLICDQQIIICTFLSPGGHMCQM